MVDVDANTRGLIGRVDSAQSDLRRKFPSNDGRLTRRLTQVILLGGFTAVETGSAPVCGRTGRRAELTWSGCVDTRSGGRRFVTGWQWSNLRVGDDVGERRAS